MYHFRTVLPVLGFPVLREGTGSYERLLLVFKLMLPSPASSTWTVVYHEQAEFYAFEYVLLTRKRLSTNRLPSANDYIQVLLSFSNEL